MKAELLSSAANVQTSSADQQTATSARTLPDDDREPAELPQETPPRRKRTAALPPTRAPPIASMPSKYSYSDPILRRRLLVEHALDLDAIPPLLHEADICRDPQRPDRGGLLPMTRPTFRKAVADGYIEKPVRIGKRGKVWRRLAIIKILLEGTKDPTRRALSRPELTIPPAV